MLVLKVELVIDVVDHVVPQHEIELLLLARLCPQLLVILASNLPKILDSVLGDLFLSHQGIFAILTLVPLI